MQAASLNQPRRLIEATSAVNTEKCQTGSPKGISFGSLSQNAILGVVYKRLFLNVKLLTVYLDDRKCSYMV